MGERSIERRTTVRKLSLMSIDPRMPVRDLVPEFSNGGIRVKARADKRGSANHQPSGGPLNLKRFYGCPLETLVEKRQNLQSAKLKQRRETRDNNRRVPIWARATESFVHKTCPTTHRNSVTKRNLCLGSGTEKNEVVQPKVQPQDILTLKPVQEQQQISQTEVIFIIQDDNAKTRDITTGSYVQAEVSEQKLDEFDDATTLRAGITITLTGIESNAQVVLKKKHTKPFPNFSGMPPPVLPIHVVPPRM